MIIRRLPFHVHDRLLRSLVLLKWSLESDKLMASQGKLSAEEPLPSTKPHPSSPPSNFDRAEYQRNTFSIPPLSTAKSITALTLRLYWFFISKYMHFRPLLLSDLFEIHIVSSEIFLGGSNCRHLRLRYQGSVRQLPPTLSTILFDSKPNLLMESEMKKVSAASPSRLLIFLLPGSREIHLVSRSNIDGCRAVLFRLTGSVTSIGFPPLFQPLSLGYFNVCSDYSKLFRAVVSRIQVKVIRRFLYFELVSLFNTSIPCCIVFLLLLFILSLSIPLVVVVETL
ncbi:hypothetical protein DY000_02019885 [Brassica cretica]|uniref:Uncharacterized protein n=1 Tax=Brassica cretica TaxID=69181 RepID=A0ABQ7D311_BRACR|nr:hypothetical protein DY000_02019885 [Brassica cretica]